MIRCKQSGFGEIEQSLFVDNYFDNRRSDVIIIIYKHNKIKIWLGVK